MKRYRKDEYDALNDAIAPEEWLRYRLGDEAEKRLFERKWDAIVLNFRKAKRDKRALKAALFALTIGLILLYGYRP